MTDNLVHYLGNHVVDCTECPEMPLIRQTDARRTETPNAVMTTLASPTIGGAGHAVWRVDMRRGQAGPAHAFDVEQVWTVVRGGATVVLAGEALAVTAGDTVVMPAVTERRILADPQDGFAAIVSAPAGARATLPDGTDKGVPAWIE
jgi:quercetin dioxygenase-like cupin family protein